MSDRDARDRAGGPDVGDEPLTPELRHAVAALRRLPPTSPDAVARVVAAAAARGASTRDARRVRVRRWSVGTLAAVAAGLALLVAGGRGRPSETSRDVAAAPATALLAVGHTVDAAPGDDPQPVTFVLREPGARAVAVVGDFNRWDARATPLARRPDGRWAVTVPLTPGRHGYRFVVDDSRRVLDPRAPAERDADLGVARSIVVVGVP